jgi:hypothetical protein
MQCPSCHATIEAGLIFCPECGARLSPTATPPPPAATGRTTSLSEPPPPQPDALMYGSPTYGDPAFGVPSYGATAAQSTKLAQVSRWMGLISAGVMLLATLMIVGGAAIDSEGGSVLAGFGVLIVLPALICGPIASLLGLLALTNPQTATTAFGRRHATVGAAAGLVVLLLCCVVAIVIGAQAPSEGVRPQAITSRTLALYAAD